MLAKNIDALYLGGEIFQKGMSYQIGSLTAQSRSYIRTLDYSALSRLSTAKSISDLGKIDEYRTVDNDEVGVSELHHIYVTPLVILNTKFGAKITIAHVQYSYSEYTESGRYDIDNSYSTDVILN